VNPTACLEMGMRRIIAFTLTSNVRHTGCLFTDEKLILIGNNAQIKVNILRATSIIIL